jgi:hypothetical protein
MIETDPRNRLITVGGLLVVVMVVLVVVLFLPPFRLLERISGGGYDFLTVENPTASHQEGIQVVARPDELDGKFGVNLSSVPRLTFLEGSAGAELKRAAEALPPNLMVKSPYYQISTQGNSPSSTVVAVDIPQDAEPWETLDLYTWTGEGWAWIGGRVDASRGLLLAEVGTDVPDDVVVMQVGAVSPAIHTELLAEQTVDSVASNEITHLLLVGLSLGTEGRVDGDPTALPMPTANNRFALMPTLRNWSQESGQTNQAALADLLATPEMRQAHVSHLVALVIGQGYAGVDLDYRGVSEEWQKDFTQFVADLATALHEQGKTLSVVVQAPEPRPEGGWDTGGYDWRALGQVADMVRAPFPIDFLFQGGDIEGYMSWALAQVSRYKFSPIFSAHSIDSAGQQVKFLTLDEALHPLAEVSGPDGTIVSPGEIVRVELKNEAVTTLQYDQESQTYSYTYHDDAGAEHRVTVVTAASLGKRLDWAARYHLGGVSITGMLEPGTDVAIGEVVRQFVASAPANVSGELHVTWTAQAASGSELARKDRPLAGTDSFEWTAPEAGGDYRISAIVASRSGTQANGTDGKGVSISVSTPTPEATAAPTATPTPESDESSAELTTLSTDCLNSIYVADVTVPDNTRFEKSESFVKTWRVRNNGSCAWPEDTQLNFVSGDILGAAKTVDVGALEAGATTEVSVDMVAADSDGNYKGVWRLSTGDGEAFGTQLTVVIKVGEAQAANPDPAPAPPPSGGGGAFELGGHLRTWNYVAQMKQSGMNWAKTQIHFGQDAVGWVSAAHNNGFKIQLSALGSPNMVTQPNFHSDYASWVASLAAAGADAIEVWNEPNIEREWQIGHISPQAYTELLCAAYSAIKAANPNTAVISAAPAPTGYFGGCSGNGCDDLPWLQGMYNAGAANCMDYIGAHHNSGATSPSASSGHPADSGGGHHSWYFLPQTRLYYNTFGGSRKLFYTEMGYASQEGLEPFSDQFAWARGTTNAQQAAWLSEAVNLSRSTGMVKCIIVWNIDFTRYGYDPQDGYAIIRPGGGCPACDALRAVMQ